MFSVPLVSAVQSIDSNKLPSPRESHSPAMDPTPQPRRGPHFGIGLLILFTTLVAVAAAAMGGLQRGGDERAFFVIFTLVAPGLVLILVSLYHRLTRDR